MKPCSTQSRRTTRSVRGRRWKTILKAFSTTSPPLGTSIRSSSTNVFKIRNLQNQKQHQEEEYHETSRLHQDECRTWSGNGDHDAVVTGICTDKNGAQGSGRPPAGLSDGGSRSCDGQEAGSRHQWPAVDPDVPVD